MRCSRPATPSTRRPATSRCRTSPAPSSCRSAPVKNCERGGHDEEHAGDAGRLNAVGEDGAGSCPWRCRGGMHRAVVLVWRACSSSGAMQLSTERSTFTERRVRRQVGDGHLRPGPIQPPATCRVSRWPRGASASPCDEDVGRLRRCGPRHGSSWRARHRGRKIPTSWRMGRRMRGRFAGRAVP